jgi:hypothetical protein
VTCVTGAVVVLAVIMSDYGVSTSTIRGTGKADSCRESISGPFRSFFSACGDDLDADADVASGLKDSTSCPR